MSSEDDRSSERASHQGTGHTSHDRSGKASDPGLGTYVRFGLMILTSSVVMYIVMYLNGLTPFRRSSRYESRPVARGGGQGDWSDHDEQ